MFCWYKQSQGFHRTISQAGTLEAMIMRRWGRVQPLLQPTLLCPVFPFLLATWEEKYVDGRMWVSSCMFTEKGICSKSRPELSGLDWWHDGQIVEVDKTTWKTNERLVRWRGCFLFFLKMFAQGVTFSFLKKWWLDLVWLRLCLL